MAIGPSARIGLVGPSGCGKSSLLRVIAMLDPIDLGEIRFYGDIVSHDEIPGYRRRVVYLHQRPAIILSTVRENLAIANKVKTSAVDFDESLAKRWFDRIGKPASMLDQNAEQLSGGERQLVALVRAMMLDPIAILLDEPTASLDEDSVYHVESVLRDWLDEDSERRLVWVSHDRSQVHRVTDRIVEMVDGKLV